MGIFKELGIKVGCYDKLRKTLKIFWDRQYFQEMSTVFRSASKRIREEHETYREYIEQNPDHKKASKLYIDMMKKHAEKLETIDESVLHIFQNKRKNDEAMKKLLGEELLHQNAITIDLPQIYKDQTEECFIEGGNGSFRNINYKKIDDARSAIFKDDFERCYETHIAAFDQFNAFAFELKDHLGDTLEDLVPIKDGKLDPNKCIKSRPRSFYKFLIKYSKDGRKLKDLLRCTLIFKDGAELQKALNALILKYSMFINQIKNGWASYEYRNRGEYVDVKIIFMIPPDYGGDGECCEVQL